MGALSASSISYSIAKIKKLEDGRKIVQATLTFGDGSSTYPTGGIPLLGAKLGCPVAIDSMTIEDLGTTGYVYSFRKAIPSLKLFQSAGLPAHAHNLLLKNAAVADGATTRVNAGSNLLGANTGSDITVAGAGANGGVQNNTAGSDVAMNEVGSSVAPALTVIKVSVIGY